MDIVLFILVVFVSVIEVALLLKKASNKEKIALAREKAYQLFLIAEKQGWSGQVKMNWVIRALNLSSTSKGLLKLVDEDQLSDWAQNLYEEYKLSIRKTKT